LIFFLIEFLDELAAGLAFTLVPLGIGVMAERFGLGAAMWSLLLGSVALWIGITGKIPD
jgi:putative effector of murein hydrolase LrgA (UPF0299 family)